MAYRLVGATPVSEPMLKYWYSNLRNKLQWNLKRIPYIFIEENVLKYVVREMATNCLDLNVLSIVNAIKKTLVKHVT